MATQHTYRNLDPLAGDDRKKSLLKSIRDLKRKVVEGDLTPEEQIEQRLLGKMVDMICGIGKFQEDYEKFVELCRKAGVEVLY